MTLFDLHFSSCFTKSPSVLLGMIYSLFFNLCTIVCYLTPSVINCTKSVNTKSPCRISFSVKEQVFEHMLPSCVHYLTLYHCSKSKFSSTSIHSDSISSSPQSCWTDFQSIIQTIAASGTDSAALSFLDIVQAIACIGQTELTRLGLLWKSAVKSCVLSKNV